MLDWEAGETRPVGLEALGQSYRRYRLPDVEAEAVMARSLKRYGQVSPVVVCRREEALEVVDGFKRLSAARTGVLKTLSCKLLEADERAAKAAIYGLNRAGRQTSELEEAWIVQALVREDGLSQVEAAELLGRHKTWVCRRLALLEKLAPEAREDLRVGLLTPTAARCLTRLPAGNQAEVLATARREGLSAVEMRGVVELLSSTANQSQAEFVLARPREALQQANRMPTRLLDPRLSVCGNRIARQLGMLLDLLARQENWLRHRGRVELSPGDREVLIASFARLGCDCRTVADLADDLVEDLRS